MTIFISKAKGLVGLPFAKANGWHHRAGMYKLLADAVEAHSHKDHEAMNGMVECALQIALEHTDPIKPEMYHQTYKVFSDSSYSQALFEEAQRDPPGYNGFRQHL